MSCAAASTANCCLVKPTLPKFKMAKVNTSELTGLALDWAVARSLGKLPSMSIFQQTGKLPSEYSYSTNWSQGGPIIESARIALHCGVRLQAKEWMWTASKKDHSNNTTHAKHGPTPLTAAMRCFVASKLGDEVEVPDELIT